jgi:hypothetical protein
MAGIVIEIPYVQVVEEKVERNTINVKLNFLSFADRSFK